MSDRQSAENNRYMGIGAAVTATLFFIFLALLFAHPFPALCGSATGAAAYLLIKYKNK